MTDKSDNQAHSRLGRQKEELEAKQREIQRLKDQKAQFGLDIQKLAQLPEFKRVAQVLLAKGGVFTSVMTGNSNTYYLAGKQDLARECWSAIAQVDLGFAHEILKPSLGEDTDG